MFLGIGSETKIPCLDSVSISPFPSKWYYLVFLPIRRTSWRGETPSSPGVYVTPTVSQPSVSRSVILVLSTTLVRVPESRVENLICLRPWAVSIVDGVLYTIHTTFSEDRTVSGACWVTDLLSTSTSKVISFITKDGEWGWGLEFLTRLIYFSNGIHAVSCTIYD